MIINVKSTYIFRQLATTNLLKKSIVSIILTVIYIANCCFLLCLCQQASVAATKSFSVSRNSLLDPAVNLCIERMKKDLEAARTKMEEAQNELAAWKFTPDRCAKLYNEIFLNIAYWERCQDQLASCWVYVYGNQIKNVMIFLFFTGTILSWLLHYYCGMTLAKCKNTLLMTFFFLKETNCSESEEAAIKKQCCVLTC